MTLLEHHLSELPPSVRPTAAEISATMEKSGMQLPEDRVAGMMTPDTAETAQVRRTGWTGLRQLLLRGLAVGMTALTAPLKMRTRATWEAPWPLVVRTPLLLKDPKLAEDLPRVRAAGKLAIALGVSLEQLRDSNAVDIQAANGTGEMMSPVGTAAIGTGVAVLLICSHAKNRIIASPGRWVS